MSAELRTTKNIIRTLKSGEYDGADIMQAWCRLKDLQRRVDELEAKLAEQKPLPLPNHFLPDCMMPDGAEPCIAYQQLHTTARAMEAKLADKPATIAVDGLLLLCEEYSAEGLSDLGRDVSEAVDPDYNAAAAKLPNDEYGFTEGTYRVSIVWCSPNACAPKEQEQ